MVSDVRVAAFAEAERPQAWVVRTEPAARLVEARVLRRVIKRAAGLTGFGLDVPHGEVFVAPVGVVRRATEAGEVWPALPALDGDAVILVAEPEGVAVGSDAWVRQVWRRLYHGRIDLALRRLQEHGRLDRFAVRRRVHQLGHAEFDEIHQVLWQEGRLVPPRDDVSVYCEFVATWLELRTFEPDALERSFPSLEDERLVLGQIGELIDADSLLAQTRLAEVEPVDVGAVAPSMPSADPPAPLATCSREQAVRLLGQARVAMRRGNHARAALLATRVRCCVDPATAEQGRWAVQHALDVLARRVAASVDDGGLVDELARSLERLLPWASRGRFSIEARLIFDLQRACVEAEREVFRVDFWWWLSALGTIPLLRALPGKRVVNVRRHVERAHRRASRCRLPSRGRVDLEAVLERATERATERLRGYFGPRLRSVLVEVGLGPSHVVEEVALDRMVEELCDRIASRGFIAMSDLRDAVARSPIKLEDVTSVRTLWAGDALLRANKSLGLILDDVYRRAEIYLRALQRSTSLAFGTRQGRWVVLFAALPFGGAYVVLEGVYHILHPLVGLFGGDFPRAVAGPVPVVGLGVFLLGFLHAARFRAGVLRVLSGLRAGLSVVARLPGWVWSRPWVRRVVESRLARAFGRLVLKPGVLFGLVVGGATAMKATASTTLAAGLVAFGVANAILNTKTGRHWEEVTLDAVGSGLRRVWSNVLPGVVRWAIDTFREGVEAIERGLYAVDEWLRFRSTDSRVMRWLKVAGSILWAVVTYLARIYITLLIEPQINPIKHFPVVTVSHKLMLPVAVPSTRALASVLSPLGPVVANTIAATTVTLSPGVFGFLAWELKENWRLYAANRAVHLPVARVGAHGETMQQLLRPGFHSGTLPKLYRKLRRAERRGAIGRVTGKAGRLRAELAEVSHGVVDFVERQLLALLRRSPAWVADTPEVVVRVGANRVIVALTMGAARALELTFEEHDGVLMLGVEQLGWAATLSAEGREVLRAGLLGLAAMAGVELVREHVRRRLPPGSFFDVAHQHLVVWGASGVQEARYALGHATMKPDPPESGMPTLRASDLLLSRQPIAYGDWVAFWRAAEQGDVRRTLLPTVEILPA